MNLKDIEESRDYFQSEMNKNWELFGKACGEISLLQKEIESQKVIINLAVKALEMLADNDFYNSGEFDPCEEARYTLEEIKIKGGTS